MPLTYNHVRNHFLGITAANRKRLNKILQGDVGSSSTLPCKLLAPSAKLSKCRRNNTIWELYVSKTTHRFTHFPAADFREIWTQNVNRPGDEFFRNRISNFSHKGSFTPTILFWGFEGVLPVRTLQPWLLGQQRIWALHLIVDGLNMVAP